MQKGTIPKKNPGKYFAKKNMDPFTDFSPEDIEATLGDNCELDYFLEEKDLFPAFLDQLFSGNSFFTPENLSSPCKSSSSGVDRIDDKLPLSCMPEQLNDKSPCTSNHKNKIPSLAARRLQYKKNLLAEKRRRETLNKQFIALSTILPGITKVIELILLLFIENRNVKRGRVMEMLLSSRN